MAALTPESTALSPEMPTILDLSISNPVKAVNSASASWKPSDVREICRRHGIYTGLISEKRQLLSMLKKSFSQPLVFDGFSTQKLLDL